MDQEIEKNIRNGQLLGHHLTNSPEPGEEEKMEAWLQEPAHRELYREISSPEFLRQSYQFHQTVHPEQEYELFRKKQRRQAVFRTLRYGIPAAALLVIGFTVALIHKSEDNINTHTPPPAHAEILPGSSKAILVLENNEQISLSDVREEIKEQGEVVADLKDATLSYRNQNPSATTVPRHRLITPVGGEYQLMLADGTRVWLNANSELSYPVRFSGKEREIILHGEAYFEVAPDQTMPFRIHTDKFDIVVTGTAFNVSVYPEEIHHQVALVRGGVNILSGKQLVAALQPGKQMDYRVSDGQYVIKDADLEAITAWKDGLFLFREEPLSSITRKLGRWYNVAFILRNENTERCYSGTIKRDEPLKQTLDILKMTHEIDFRWKDNREIEVITLP